MKRRFFLLSFLFISILTSAQVNLEDSKVSIVAYWDVGDEMVYEYRKQDMDIIGNDTLPSKEPTHIEQFSLEVIDSTTEGYTIKYTLLDYKHVILNNGVEKEVDMPWQSLSKGTTATIRTNKLGELIEVGHWDIPRNENEDNIAKEVVGDDPFSKISHVADLFNYYGTVVYKDSIRSWYDKMPSDWNDEFIDVDCAVSAFDETDDKEFIRIVHVLKPDSEQLTENHKAHFSQLDVNPVFLEQLSTLSAQIVTQFTLHDPSGWIVEYLSERKTTMAKKTTLSIWEIRILFEDETDFYQK